MNPTSLLPVLLCSAALAAQATLSTAAAPAPGHASAGQPAPLVDGTGLFGPTGVLHDRLGDTEWAAGATWKAGFAPGGATFVPFLGSDAERNWPVTFVTQRVTVAGADLAVQTDAIASRDGLRVTYHRGAVDERYDLGKDGMEQSFCFASLPARGALVVEVAVRTDLECQPDGGGFRFVGPRGGVRYGAAVAIDARGRRLDVPTAWRQGTLQMTVPAAFVEQAALPLVIDPIVGSFATLFSSATTLLWPDACFDPTTGVYVTSYESVFSQTDSDVFLKRADAALNPLGAATVVDVSTTSWRRPRIAGADIGNLELVVAEASTDNLAPFKVAGRAFVDGLTPSTGQFDIAQNASNPDVGGDSRGMIPVMFLVAYEVDYSATDHDIHVRTVGSTGNLGTAHAVDQSTTFEREPVVSKNNGTLPGSPVWGIVYRRNDTATTGHVRAACTNGLAVTVPNWSISPVVENTNASWSISSVADTPSGRTFLAAWTRASLNGYGQPSSYPIGLLFDGNGTTLYGPWHLSALSSFARFVDCDSDGCRFAATWVEDVNSAMDNVKLDLVAWNGSVVTSTDNGPSLWVPADVITADRRPSLTGRQSGAFSARHVLVWGRLDSGTSRIDAQLYDAMSWQYNIPYGWTQRSTGCGSLPIARTGEGNLGAPITVSLPTAQGFAGFVAGAPVSLPVGACLGCTQGAHGATFLGPNLTVNIPCELGLIGATLAFQGWDCVSAGGPCLGQLHISDTLDLTVR